MSYNCLKCGQVLFNRDSDSITINELWKKGDPEPVARYILCLHCGTQNNLDKVLGAS